eukprot:356133-Chlamydomonas_euryale.AAC.27
MTCCRLLAAGDVRVWGLLFKHGAAAMPMPRDDARWERLGASVPRPRFADLARQHRGLCFGVLTEWPDSILAASEDGAMRTMRPG